ncbi:TPA: hypothetical protein NGT43_002428 [Vibrio parahaemolyticus]|uniref:hypothetical protein n=1 Tax=Vibrio parahaemolyticus TaxID=670 RepID=UPI000420C44D|nr:hypothetical protein [Vibrio parahaemolyticus]MEA5240734.1 hypothetical protein [Vibrio parahaemolyticus]RFD45414.1 hypothetical protein BS586_10730 [Vibrio parahaemolyticus]TBT79899.1 hypothetical protein D5E70_15185 [Vibrio parahaemolyticus]TNZ96625.1 hypothetical protein CGK37_03065 [Vibrio parahaemolyticus]TOA14368.1 hypothetical protein CGK34_09160 [Vibrio parahaemolyticus]
MNKVSLLAASVAIALTGCGGSDSGSSSASNGVVITGFDGYFKNAVVFEDTNNNGQWDTQESILGLTDEKGQLTLAAKPEKTLALQTLVPNGAKQKQLIALDAKKYAGTYTVDMDHPSQAMAHEIVFRAPSSSNVISPITDLVAIEMAKDPSITEEDAKANVNKALGGSEEAPIDLYSDFVEGATKNAELHKTAQILTESKAQNPTNYEKKATEFAQAANQEVDRLVASGENINDPSLRPVITDSTPNSDNLAPETLVNNKLTVNETVEDAAEDKLDKLPEIVKGAAFDGVELNIEGLFKDKDQSLVSTKLTHNLAGTGIEVEQVGNLIVLHPTAIVEKSGDFEIVLTAQDKNSNGDVLSTVSTVFEIEIESANLPPMVVEAEQARLQSIVDGWYLQQGELFEQTLDISGLFQDKDGQITDYSADYVGIEGLSAIEDGNAIVTIKGTPTKAGESGAALTISATDGHTAVQIALSMPEVKEGVTPPPTAHPLEGKTWYYLEHGSDDGDDNDEFDYSRVWCESIKFEGGVVYGNVRSSENRTECTDADTQKEQATYKVENGRLIATFQFEEDGESLTESFEVDVAGNADELAKGAKTIVQRPIALDEKAERYTYFADAANAESRIQVKSDDSYDKRFGYIYLPAEQDNVYDLGMVSFALVEGSQGYKAYINFDVEGKDFSCDTIDEFYKSFTFSGNDLTTPYSQHYIGGSCNTITDEEYDYASIYFDLSQIQSLDVKNIYSFIGYANDKNAEYIEAVKFNIEWTGEGDNE